MTKRRLTLLLVAALLVQIFTLGVFAEDTYEEEVVIEVFEDIYFEDPEYHQELHSNVLREEETLTFKSFTTKPLAENQSLRCGVDVSSYQEDIDWEAVKADGVEFAFIRVGYRGYGTGKLVEDSYYKKNIEGALAVGIKVGVYVYSQAITVEEGVEEAQFLMDRVAGYDIDLPLIIDYEYAYDGGHTGRLYEAGLTKEEATAICHAFCDAAAEGGYTAAVYANKSFLNTQLNADELESVWLAHYIKKTDYTGDYDFWQCTSSGRVKGITGYVDLDFWFMDFPFRDVPLTYWGYDGIRYAYELGIVNGVGVNAYAPESNTTRGQVATMLYRMEGSPKVEQSATFTDLTADYYRDAIAWAQQNGVINGRTETTFDPDAAVTRQELVAMLYRLSDEPKTMGTLDAFQDADQVDEYAKTAMAWAVELGIIQGVTGTVLKPDGNATRAQIATILMRYMEIR